jgi:hypothetical protein
MNEDKDLDTRIAEKEVEIEHYKGCLQRYGPGRWTNAGKRHLEELQQELKDLRSKL